DIDALVIDQACGISHDLDIRIGPSNTRANLRVDVAQGNDLGGRMTAKSADMAFAHPHPDDSDAELCHDIAGNASASSTRRSPLAKRIGSLVAARSASARSKSAAVSTDNCSSGRGRAAEKLRMTKRSGCA